MNGYSVVHPPGEAVIRNWYTRIARVSAARCQTLAPSLTATCIDANVLLVSETSDEHMAFGSMGPQRTYGVYGLFELDDGRFFILPLKWFDSENDALNWLDRAEGSESEEKAAGTHTNT